MVDEKTKLKNADHGNQLNSHLQLMSHKQYSLSFQAFLDVVFKDVFSDMGVYSTEGIIQKINVTVRVQCSS